MNTQFEPLAIGERSSYAMFDLADVRLSRCSQNEVFVVLRFLKFLRVLRLSIGESLSRITLEACDNSRYTESS